MDSGGCLSTASSSTATLTLLKPAAAAAAAALPSSSSVSPNGGGAAQQLTASSASTSTTNEHTPISSNSSSSSLNSLANTAAASAAAAAPAPPPPASSNSSSIASPSLPPPASSQQVEAVTQTMEKMSIDDAGRQSQSLRPRHLNSENTLLPSSSGPSSMFSPLSASSSSSAISASPDPVVSSASSSSSGSSSKKKAISYAAERVIGNGSFGVVYQATVIDTGETVAIKKVLQDRRFKNRELEIMSSLNHPNVVALKHCFYSKGEKPEEVYLNLVMEYIPETIHRTLRNHTKANKLVPVLYTKVYMYQIARALAYIHAQGICHRDIKPQNLLLNPKTHEVKLCDFGSAKCFPEHDTRVLTDSGFLFLQQIKEREERGERVLYACYEVATQRIAYSPGDVVVVPNPARWVDFTQAATRRLWDATSDDYGSTVPAAGKVANYLSLRTTPQHEMYVQLATTTRERATRRADNAVVPPHKMLAKELAPGFRCSCEVDGTECSHGYPVYRLCTGAPSGVALSHIMSIRDLETPERYSDSPVVRLGLRTTDQLNAFLELYGYWTGDGSMEYSRTKRPLALIFTPKKERDWPYLRGLIARLCLKDEEWSEPSADRADGCQRFAISAERWCVYFDEQYGLKYAGSYYSDPAAAVAKLGNSRPFGAARRPSLSTASTQSSAARSGGDSRRVSFSSSSNLRSYAAASEEDVVPSSPARRSSLSSSSEPARSPSLSAQHGDPSAALGTACAVCGYASGPLYSSFDHAAMCVTCIADAAADHTSCFACSGTSSTATDPLLRCTGWIDTSVRRGGVLYLDGHRCGRAAHLLCSAFTTVAAGGWLCARHAPVPPSDDDDDDVQLDAEVEAAAAAAPRPRSLSYPAVALSAATTAAVTYAGSGPRRLSGSASSGFSRATEAGMQDSDEDDEAEPTGKDEAEEPSDPDEGEDEPDEGEDEPDDPHQPEEPEEPGQPYDPDEETPAKSCKWFWWWVMKRNSKEQLRLILEGLRQADGLSARSKQQVARSTDFSGQRHICTSSVSFRDALIQVCLHAGYSAYFTINTRAGSCRGYNAVPTDYRIYNEAEMLQLRAADRSRDFTEVLSNYDNWWVKYTLSTVAVLAAADVRYDGEPLQPRAKPTRTRHSGYVAQHGRLGLHRASTQPELAEAIGLDEQTISRYADTGKQTRSGWQIFTKAAYEERTSSTSAQAAATEPADEYAARDGRTWCVNVKHKDHLIFVQRAHRNAAGIVSKVSKPVVCGNCFAAGTRVRLYSGGLVAVEDVRGGELLMGDDGQPRVVTAGSLARGRAVMYRVTPQWEGAEPLTVNGSHILVLVNNSRPAATKQADGGWRVHWFELDSSCNVMTRQSSPLYLTEAEAAAHVVQQLSTSAPIEWEVSVDDFLQAEAAVRDACLLFQSGPVTFASSPHSSLQSVLSSVLGLPASPSQIHWAAWFLGLCSGDDSSTAAPYPLPPHVLSRCEDYTALFGQPLPICLSSAGQPASAVVFDTGSLLRRLLDACGLSRHDRSERVPHAWLCDSLDVRRRILAGFLDSSCRRHAEEDCFTATVRHHSTAAGLKELAGSLGIRCGAISQKLQPNLQTGNVQDCFTLSFSGALSAVLQHTALPSKQHPSPQPMSADCEEEGRRCFGIASIAELPVSDYFGFAVHGGANHRFLLEDFTVSHNSLHPGEPNVSYICSRYYRAPELVFEATEYTAMIDVWSLGCVFVELLIGNPLFPGDSGVGQLIEIIKVLGSPTREEVLAMNPTPTSFRFPHISPQPWSKVFRNSKVPAAAIDLASRWLRYRPTDRLDPFDSLLHPFFDELREEGVRMPNGRELPELFEWKDSERDKMRKRGAAARLYERMTPAWYRRRRGEQVDDQEQDAAAAAAAMAQQQTGGAAGLQLSPSSSAGSGEGSQRLNGELLNGHRGMDAANGAVAMDRDGT